MVTLQITNRHVRIIGADRTAMRMLEKVCSYLVAGHVFSPAFQTRRWDGREHLLTYSSKHGYRAPIGLLGDIAKALQEAGVEYDLDNSARRAPKRKYQFGWNPEVVLRDYQKTAVKAVTDPSQWDFGLGILKMPIRSGKTKTSAGVIRKLGVRTLFIVPSQMLLHQTCDALRETLELEPGVIGDSEWKEGEALTVATIQTLARARGGERKSKDGTVTKHPMDPRYRDMIHAYDCVVFDECHHLRGDVWHKAMMDFDARYRIGLSATAYLDNERENERGVIWLKACCGDVRIDIPTSKLIEAGYLMKQTVELHAVREPDLTGRKWSQTLLAEAIHENKGRNERVADLAKDKVNDGLKVLIVSNRLNQISSLSELLEGLGVTFEVVTGDSTAAQRRERVERFVKGEVAVLLGTVFGEGVDIPEIECVINAEGGRDVKATVQRMRNMTPAKGKTEAVFIDFMDMTNAYFAQHSKERLGMYKSEPAFVIRFIQ